MQSPIDFVVTWVDGEDDLWKEKKAKALGIEFEKKKVDNEQRYRDWNTFKYWFRGVETFAPWVNHIYLVTDQQVPSFIDETCDKLTIIDHRYFIPNQYLPTFNSNAIELNLHRIDNLSEQFVYFNDDMFLIRNVKPEDFFIDGLPRDYASLNAITGYVGEPIQSISLNNVSVINKHFNKNQSIKSNINKWFNTKTGLKMMRTVLLMPWSLFTGFSEPHCANSYLKSTFVDVWEKEHNLLSHVSSHKVRNATDVNQWLMRYWQIAKGTFVPRSYKFGAHFDLNHANIETCKNHILNKASSIVCINDTVEAEHIEYAQSVMSKALEEILPNKSKFEK